jgi:hypothetical protein
VDRGEYSQGGTGRDGPVHGAKGDSAVNAIEMIVARLDALITKGNNAAAAMRYPDSDGLHTDAAYETYQGWHAQALTCIVDLTGPDSEYHKNFALQTRSAGSTAARIGVGILTSLREDVASGNLRRTADLVAGEVFSDFLEMAGHLLTAGYYVPAASLVGAVLEEGLRRLAGAKQVKVAAEDDVSALNNRLASKNVYSLLVRKQVDLWAGIRNAADHGHFDQIKPGVVAAMHSGVEQFLAEQLG